MSQPQNAAVPPLSAEEAEALALIRTMPEKQRSDLFSLVKALANPYREGTGHAERSDASPA